MGHRQGPPCASHWSIMGESSSWCSTGACVMDNMRNLQDGVCQYKNVTLVECFCGQWGKGEFVDAVFLQMCADSLSQTRWTSWRLYSSKWEHSKVVVSQADGWCQDWLFVLHERLCMRQAELRWLRKALEMRRSSSHFIREKCKERSGSAQKTARQAFFVEAWWCAGQNCVCSGKEKHFCTKHSSKW